MTGESSRAERIPVTLLQRRGIEAEVLVPFIRRLERELGPERAHALARETIAEIAREQGRAVADSLGRDDLEGFGEVRDSWGGAGGDLTIEPVRHDADHLDFDVTRCRFAELYERLGARDLGFVLSCGRDFTLSEGYSPRLRLERTQTIMQGAAYCDFRYTYASAASAPEADTMTDTPGDTDDTDTNETDDAAHAGQPRRSHIARGIGMGWGAGDDVNEDAKDMFTEGVRRATEAGRAAADRARPGAQQAAREAAEQAQRAAHQARERIGQAAEAARPQVEHVAKEVAEYAKEHQDELKSAALRAARIAARLTIPQNVRDAFEAEVRHDGRAAEGADPQDGPDQPDRPKQ